TGRCRSLWVRGRATGPVRTRPPGTPRNRAAAAGSPPAPRLRRGARVECRVAPREALRCRPYAALLAYTAKGPSPVKRRRPTPFQAAPAGGSGAAGGGVGSLERALPF